MPHSFLTSAKQVLPHAPKESNFQYLGVPIITKRPSVTNYRGILDKIQDKLQQWVISKLSEAGRRTLIVAVLTAFPTYVFCTCLIPKAFISTLEKIFQQFFWDNGPGHGDVTREDRNHLQIKFWELKF